MSDAQQLESVKTESLDDAIAAELAALDQTEEVEETPEVTEEVEEGAIEASEATEEVEEEPEAEEKLQPYDHWRAEYKEGFSSMSREQQELWVQREREFEEGIRGKGQELSQAKKFIGELHQIVEPMVNEWARQGLQPAAGIRKAIALEQALRDDPQKALMALAQERGVDLQQTWAEQPYKDPAIVQLESKLQEQERRIQEFNQQREIAQQNQEAQARQTAFEQIVEMRDARDESGSPKYPYLEDVMPNMTMALESGRARSLESAYNIALQELRNHPAIRELLAKETRQTSEQRRSETQKAKAAAKTVDSNSTGTVNQPKSLEDDIAEALEAQGIS